MKPEHPSHRYFTALTHIQIPRPMRVLMQLVIGGLILGAFVLAVVPWVQTAKGVGRVTTLKPESQLQAINAPVQGRIERWYVRDGAEVRTGDPIVDIVDNDPSIIERLEAERNAASQSVSASELAAETAKRNLDRQKALYGKGLSSRREYEQAVIEYKTWLTKAADAASMLASTETRLSRQLSQRVTAPGNGRIVRTYAGASATLVKEGQALADFLPEGSQPAVELYLQGIDMPLVQPGQLVRLQFEGWPIVQFSGWPSRAVGTFGGVVAVVDPAASPDGRLRILVTAADGEEWPEARYLPFGTRAKGWVLLSTVTLGYELWRQLNSFPPEPVHQVAQP
jgi:biotin carboxyl carrier protein